MFKKYNIAFVPENLNQFCELAQFYPEPYNYYLGKNSIPHITITQFFHSPENIIDIWKKISNTVNQKKIQLIFSEFSNISFDNEIFWFSLIPNQRDFLKEIHKVIFEVTGSIRNDEYDPHLTLFNYLVNARNLPAQVYNKDIMIQDNFNLVLGECDSIGQIIKRIMR